MISNPHRLQIFRSLLLIPVICFSNVSAQTPSTFPSITLLSESDIRNSAIAFVSTSTTPGLTGATLSVDNDERTSEQLRSSLGFSAEFTIKKHIFNGYWGLAIVGGTLDDQISIIADNGQPVDLVLTRKVIGLRGSLGLSFPVTQNFKMLPYLSLGASDLQTQSSFQGLTVPGSPSTTANLDTSAYMASATGSLDAIYSRWFGDNRMELAAEYDLIYTDAVSDDNPILNTSAWNQAAQVKGRYSGGTNLITSGRPWRWQVYANHTNFISFDKRSLGYTSLFEVGAGLEWHMNIKPLDWFGWQTLGISLGVITSNDVEGYNFGLTAR